MAMTKHLLGGANALLTVLRVTSGLLLIGSVAINFVNIIGRYFFSVSLQWAEEMMLFLMVGCVFLGTGLVGWAGRQIRMDVIVSLFPRPIRQALELLAEIVTIATSVALAIFALPVIRMLAAFDQRSPAANIPLVIPQAMIPLGLSLMALLVAVRLILRGPVVVAPPTDAAD
jgi:TRAP-type C4-dicarboxylate transport system permease small subunit